jgi:hypothetical protein
MQAVGLQLLVEYQVTDHEGLLVDVAVVISPQVL